MSQIATDQTQTQTPIASRKDRHVPTTISRAAHAAMHDAVRRLAEAGIEDATISGILSEMVAQHLPAYVRGRLQGRAAQIRAEADRRARELLRSVEPTTPTYNAEDF